MKKLVLLSTITECAVHLITLCVDSVQHRLCVLIEDVTSGNVGLMQASRSLGISVILRKGEEGEENHQKL